MAKLPETTTTTINTLKQQSLDIVDQATAAEFTVFELFGETDATLSYLDEMKNVAEEAAASFSQLSIQLNITQAQPTASSDMLDLLAQVIERTQARIPALERSVQEIKMEWNLL
jgi:hypothetical protein